jgi:choline/glycine/proline betaine transport protein
VQISEGLQRVVGVAPSETTQLVIIAVVTGAATASVVSGLDVGVRRLSEVNMGMAALLLIFVLVAGPTAYLCASFAENLGSYAAMLPAASLHGPDVAVPWRDAWLADWTVFYWAWWIAWAPFVGMFIARISRGRTVRGFLAGVLLAPTLAGFVWLTVFGDTALHYDVTRGAGIGDAVQQSVPAGVFAMLEQLPVAGITAVVATICVALFFVTSSDSASLVVDMIASGGNPDPPVRQRVFWAVLEGVCAATLLLAGGLKALQTAALTTALPFCLVILAMGAALVIGLRRAHASSR